MVFLETKVKQSNVYRKVKRICRHAKFITNNTNDSEGRILLLWNRDECQIQQVNLMDQLLSCKCKCLVIGMDVILIAAYARNTTNQRESL